MMIFTFLAKITHMYMPGVSVLETNANQIIPFPIPCPTYKFLSQKIIT